MALYGIVFLLAGIIMAIISLVVFISRKSIEKHGLLAIGTVIGEVERRVRINNRTHTFYDPQVEYITQNGQTLQGSIKTGTARTTHPIGTKVEIVYRDNNPKKMQEADSTASDRSFKILAIITGVLFMLGLVLVLI